MGLLIKKTVHIEDLIIDPSVQPRTALNKDKIEEYAQNYRDEIVMPPVEVHEVNGKRYLCDGFTRTAAAKKLGLSTIVANVYTNSSRGRLLMRAVQANALQGQPLTRREKHNAVIRLIEAMVALEERWSYQSIANATGLNEPTVRKIVAQEMDAPPDEQMCGDDAMVSILEKAARDARAAAARKASEQPKMNTVEQACLKKIEEFDALCSPAVSSFKKLRGLLRLMGGKEYGKQMAAHMGEIEQAMDAVWKFEQLRPVGVCDQCRAKGCERCQYRGWLTRADVRDWKRGR